MRVGDPESLEISCLIEAVLPFPNKALHGSAQWHCAKKTQPWSCWTPSHIAGFKLSAEMLHKQHLLKIIHPFPWWHIWSDIHTANFHPSFVLHYSELVPKLAQLWQDCKSYHSLSTQRFGKAAERDVKPWQMKRDDRTAKRAGKLDTRQGGCAGLRC